MPIVRIICLSAAIFLAVVSTSQAQVTTAEILEQARAEARGYEDLKKALNDPDPNMRIATFNAMVSSGDTTMRDLALELGMASADSLMKAQAFRAAILSLDRIVFNLAIDESSAEKVQQYTTNQLNHSGRQWILALGERDLKTGTFSNTAQQLDTRGQVTGLNMTFTSGYVSGELRLTGDDTIVGVLSNSRTNAVYAATATIR
jgi:hypothetical protein